MSYSVVVRFLIPVLAAMPLTQTAAAQQLNPSQPLTFVVAFAPGGVADGIARLVGQKLGSRLGQRVLIENRGGAGGNLAAKLAASAEPDGHTILVTTTAVAINESLYKRKGYEAGDLQTIAIVASTPEVLTVHASNPAKTLRDFVADSKDRTVTFGSAGVGSGSYIAAEYFFKTRTPVKLVHVPFQGGAPAVNAAVGNHIELLAISLPSVTSQISQGALRGLGIAAPHRNLLVPDVPTYAETGYPDFFASSWVALLTSAKTNRNIVVELNKAVQDILREEEIQDRLKRLGFEPIYNSAEEADSLMKSEIRRWGEMVQTLGTVAD
jgi:tripartite-type tricarboxylate transporter receptor subunit TctC